MLPASRPGPHWLLLSPSLSLLPHPTAPLPTLLPSPQTNTLRFEVAAPGTTAVVKNVANGASYRVTIAACNGDLCSAPAVLAGVVPAPTAAPAVTAPVTVSAGPVVQNVNVTGTRPAFKIPQKRVPVS